MTIKRSQIEEWDIERLSPYANNAKLHPDSHVEQIANSIEEFTFLDPVAVDEKGELLEGHGRLLAAKKRGDKTIPVIQVTGLTDAQKVAYRLAHNKLTMNTGFDPELLRIDFEFLQEEDFELSLTGFGELELSFLDDVQKDDEDAEGGSGGDDYEPTEEIESRVKLGEIWQLGRHKICCGDSTIESNVKALLGDRFGDVGMVWADPPYGIDLKPQRKLTKAIANDKQWEAKDVWSAFIPVLFDAMRNNTTAFLCQGWSEFDWTLPIVREYFTVKNKIVWYKNQIGIGYYLRPQHEDILYCWKGEPEKPVTAISNVWQIARINAPVHSCEKPSDLPLKAIEFASLPGDLIFDPFLGSAPSIIAAQKMEGSRTVYGFELSPDYCEIIIQRFEKFTGIEAKLIGNL